MLKIKLNEDATISLEASPADGGVLLSTKIKGQNGKIFLSTLELDKDQLDLIVAELITLRANLINHI